MKNIKKVFLNSIFILFELVIIPFSGFNFLYTVGVKGLIRWWNWLPLVLILAIFLLSKKNLSKIIQVLFYIEMIFFCLFLFYNLQKYSNLPWFVLIHNLSYLLRSLCFLSLCRSINTIFRLSQDRISTFLRKIKPVQNYLIPLLNHL